MPYPIVNPQGGTLLTGEETGWDTDPSSMLPGAALPMPGGAAPAAGGMDPRAIQMMLFQRLNNRPAQGPFSAIANPIVAALTARAMAPMYQQQQQQALALQRMKVLQALAGIGAQQARTGLDTAKTGELVAQSKWFKSLPEEKQNEYFAIQKKMMPSADTTARIKAEEQLTGKKIGSAEKIAGARIGSAEDIAGKRIASQENIAGQQIGAANKRQVYSETAQDERQRIRLEQKGAEDDRQYSLDIEKMMNAGSEADRRQTSLNLYRDHLKRQGEQATELSKLRGDRLKQLGDPTSPTSQLFNALKVYNGLPPASKVNFAKNNLVPLYKQASGLDLKVDSGSGWLRTIGDWIGLPNPLYGENPVMELPARSGAGTAPAGAQVPKGFSEVAPESLSDEELLRIPDDVANGLPPDVQGKRFLLQMQQGQ